MNKRDLQLLLKETQSISKPFLQRYLDASYPKQIEVYEQYDCDRLCRAPDVTVLVLAYNCAQYLEECIRSIISQRTRYSIEIIIAEDASTDLTREISFALQKRYPTWIKVVYASANVGLIRNFVRALDYVRGRYIAYTDGDDYFCDTYKIQKQVDVLEADNQVVLVHTGSMTQLDKYKFARTHISKRTERRLLALNDLDVRDFALKLFKRDPITANTPIFRKNAALAAARKIREMFSFVEWFPCQDFEFYFFIAQQGRVRFIGDNTSVHRVHNASQSANKDDQVAALRRLGDMRVKLAMICVDEKYFPEDVIQWIVATFFSRLADCLALKCENVVATKGIMELFQKISCICNPDVVNALNGDTNACYKSVKRSRRILKMQTSLPYYLLKKSALALIDK